MAGQGNILSFDDMRRSSVKQRPSLNVSKANTQKTGRRAAAKSMAETRRPGASPAKKPSVSASQRSSSRKAPPIAREARPSERTAPQRPQQTTKESRWSTIKREHSKSKAGKAFTKQFGDTTASAASSGPRAALYKGEMGRQHKKITNMQSTGSMKKVTPGVGLASRRFDWRSSPKRTAGLMVTIGLVLACVVLYPAAQQYYTTIRQNEALQAEYSALVERNESIQSEVNQLTSAEGIEDRVRKEFGWTKEGENAVTVYGVDTDTAAPSYVKNIPAGSVKAPDTWYSPLLDFVFGVS